MTQEQRTPEDRLRAFVLALFEACDWPKGGDIDGCQFQDLAEEHGLLEVRLMRFKCGDECYCNELGALPTSCYRKTSLLTGERDE